MQNPWIDLPTTAPYVLESDRAAIDNFNNDPKTTEQTHIFLDMFPLPFLGAKDAPVVLLNLNPGYVLDGVIREDGKKVRDLEIAADQILADTIRRNLAHEPLDYPFYLLDPKSRKAEAGGNEWWSRKLKYLIAECGQQRLANKVLCVEYFPYHSNRANWFHTSASVSSQQYSFQLVRNAMERNALIVIMRSSRVWLNTIKELENYENKCTLRNPQNVIVSRGNCPDFYDNIVARIRED
jgi:hypothetical protein